MPQAEIRKPTKPPPPPPPPPKDRITPYPTARSKTDLETNSINGGDLGGSEYAESSCSVPCSTRSLQPIRSTNPANFHHFSCRSESSYNIKPAPTSSSCCQGCSCHLNSFPTPCCGEIHCGCQPACQSMHCNLPYRPKIHSPCGATINHAHHSHHNVFTNYRDHHPHSPVPTHPPVHMARVPQFVEQIKPLPRIPMVCQEQHNLGNNSQPFLTSEHIRQEHPVDNHFLAMASSAASTSNGSSANNNLHSNGNFGSCGNSSGIGSLSTSSSNVRTSPNRFEEPITRVTSQAGLQNPLPSSDIPPPLPPLNPGLRNQPLINRTINHSHLTHQNSNTREAPPPPLPPPPLPTTSRQPPVSLTLSAQTSSTPGLRPPPLPPTSTGTFSTPSSLYPIQQNSNGNSVLLNDSRNDIPNTDSSNINTMNSSSYQPSFDWRITNTTNNRHQDKVEFDKQQKVQQQIQNTCAKCGQKVLPNQAACKAMDQIYHATCFVCCECNRTLIGETFWPAGDKVYCKDDYKVSNLLRL